MALVLRLVFGPLADRTGRYWALTIVGYGLTAVCVPLLAVAPHVGAAGLALGSVLILLERPGKAVRSPSKSALLAHVAGAVGRGRGFGIHKALDQIGAFAGPLLVAAVIAATGVIRPGMLVLAVPGAVAMLLLAIIRRQVPDPSVHDPPDTPARMPPSPVPEAPPPRARGRVRAQAWLGEALGAGLPPEFFRYAVAASLMTGGLVTFGILSYHLTVEGLVSTATVPISYAGAMLFEALGALVVGWVYDRLSTRVLYVVLVALVPPLALGGQLRVVLVGVGVWGLAFGIQDSTIKALVADVVAAPQRATAYAVFAGIQGAMAIVGGVVAGALYMHSLPVLVTVVAVSQLVALLLLVRTFGRTRGAPATRT